MNNRARGAIVLGGAALLTAFAYAGCTQDFDQFEPEGSTTAQGGATSAAGGSGTTTNSGATGGLGIGGNGATGGMPECTDSGDCGDNNPCTDDTCPSGSCVYTPVPDGALGNDVTTDCIDINCVGGQQMSSPDDTEVPDDANDCTTDSCDSGQGMNVPVPEGTMCSAGFCNDVGQCMGCTTDEQCGQDDNCKTFNCNGNQTCETNYEQAGPLDGNLQTTGNCQTLHCDGNGNEISQNNDNDVPPSDGNQCTFEDCDNGQPIFGNDPAGSSCGPGGSQVCSGQGTCVECVNDGDCDPGDACIGNVCTCVPDTCMTLGLTCGMAQNGCGQTLNCNNMQQDGNETDVDCGGGGGCADCVLGKKCSVGNDCVNGPCIDGVCCASQCATVCMACNVPGFLGQCHAVPALAEDPPLCTGNLSCSAASLCLLDPGQMCMMGTQCASGTCTGGACM